MYVITSARFGFRVVPILPLQDWVLEGAKHFSHFVRRDTSLLSETVSGFLGRYYYSILDNKTIFFLLIIFYLKKLCRKKATKYHAPLGNMVTMALPPPFVQNHAKTWWGRGRHWQKNIGRQLGSVHVDSIQRPTKKHVNSLTKHIICRRACHLAAYRIVVYKIKEQLVSRKKIHCRVA